MVLLITTFQQNLSMDSRPAIWLRWLCCHYLDNIFPGNPDTTARSFDIIENVPPTGTRTSFANLVTSLMHGETINCSSFTAVRWRQPWNKSRMATIRNGSSKSSIQPSKKSLSAHCHLHHPNLSESLILPSKHPSPTSPH